MVKISIDEGYAFDMLSILEVKCRQKNDYDNNKNYADLSKSIRDQVGHDTFNKVLECETYKSLINTNQKIFELLERVEKDESITAKTVHELNQVRYTLKAFIQALFFNSKLSEKKI